MTGSIALRRLNSFRTLPMRFCLSQTRTSTSLDDGLAAKAPIHRGMFGRMPVRRSTCSTGVVDLTAEEIIDMSGNTIQMQQTVESRVLNSELSAADDLSR